MLQANAVKKFELQLAQKYAQHKKKMEKPKESELMKDRFLRLSLYFNQFTDICNDTVLLPKEQKVKGGRIRKENPDAPLNIPPDVLFPKSSHGLTRSKDAEYVIHRDA